MGIYSENLDRFNAGNYNLLLATSNCSRLISLSLSWFIKDSATSSDKMALVLSLSFRLQESRFVDHQGQTLRSESLRQNDLVGIDLNLYPSDLISPKLRAV
jgi:hypothetical protein